MRESSDHLRGRPAIGLRGLVTDTAEAGPPSPTPQSAAVQTKGTLGPAGADAPCVHPVTAASAPALEPHLFYERRDEATGKSLRVSQRELLVVGANRMQTKIEVYDSVPDGEEAEARTLLSVKHIHSVVWAKQVTVHKNLLLACQLSGVSPPIEIPACSVRLYNQTENAQHMHTFFERIMAHVKLPLAPPGVSIHWWRAVGSGAVILLNQDSGRLFVTKNKDKTLSSGAHCLLKTLDLLHDLPQAFLDPAEEYPVDSRAAWSNAEARRGEPPFSDNDEGGELSLEEMHSTVQRWSLSDGVSPWMTTLIVRESGPRRSTITHFRYSVDVDPHDDGVLSAQVHSNQPLSRELKAYPVCMIPLPVAVRTKENVCAVYEKIFWYLKKLHDVHERSVEQPSPAAVSRRIAAMPRPREASPLKR